MSTARWLTGTFALSLLAAGCSTNSGGQPPPPSKSGSPPTTPTTSRPTRFPDLSTQFLSAPSGYHATRAHPATARDVANQTFGGKYSQQLQAQGFRYALIKTFRSTKGSTAVESITRFDTGYAKNALLHLETDLNGATGVRRKFAGDFIGAAAYTASDGAGGQLGICLQGSDSAIFVVRLTSNRPIATSVLRDFLHRMRRGGAAVFRYDDR